mmetsp:Transcript_129290/g.374371  ORF Transcript_129290/g.374371 Transcript_129290/m.374371 type:complete len:461 (-) Transcript_129290:191-1573(-)
MAKIGPDAQKKLKDFAAHQDAPWPDRVKLEFSAEDGNGGSQIAVWSPQHEPLHDVVRGMGMAICDFNIFYVDADGDRVRLRPSKRDIWEYIRSAREPPNKLEVIWRPLSVPDCADLASDTTARRMMAWIAGPGAGATPEQLRAAQEAVAKAGGVILPRCRTRSFIDRRGCSVHSWQKTCEALTAELGLDDGQVAILSGATERDEAKGVHLYDRLDGNKFRTQVLSYYTVLHDAKIDIMFRVQDMAMEIPVPGMHIPPINLIKMGERTFTVLPQASPHLNGAGDDMQDKWFEIPTGWKIVDASGGHFEDVLANVITPYYWHTNVVVCRNGDKYPGWRTARCGRPGTLESESCSVLTSAGTRFKFSSTSWRVLIEAEPAVSVGISPDLLGSWHHYVEMLVPCAMSGSRVLSGPRAPLAPVVRVRLGGTLQREAQSAALKPGMEVCAPAARSRSPIVGWRGYE